MSSSALLSMVLKQELAGELRVSGRLMDVSPRGSIPMATESAKVPKIPGDPGSTPPGCSEVRGPSPLLALETYMRLCDCRSLVRFFCFLGVKKLGLGPLCGVTPVWSDKSISSTVC